MGRTRTLFAVVAGVALLGLIAAPASAARDHSRGALVKFGANLTTNTQPSNGGPRTCANDDGGLTSDPCTHLMLNSEISPGNVPLKAPAGGTIKQIWVIAQHKGKFIPVVGFLTNASFQGGDGRITAHGPVLSHGSSITPGTTFKIFKFNVNIPVKKGEVLGIRAKSESTYRCDSGSVRQLLFQPPLVVGAAAVHNDGTSDCSLLIEAVEDPA